MSVVIPAHNEATIVEATIRRILKGDPTGSIEIIVVANGCNDATAAVAGAISHRVTVVEIAEASKIAALNAGDAAATVFPRAYVDADVMVTGETLLALAHELETPDGPLVCSPRLDVSLANANIFVRAHFRVWALSEYRASGHIGSGIYALSAVGRSRFSLFPDVIADDRFIQQLFTSAERSTLTERSFTVRAPATLSAQIRRATRIHAGNEQLRVAGAGQNLQSSKPDYRALVTRVSRQPALWPAFAVYCYGYLAPKVKARRLIARGQVPTWNRDDSSRV